jgi:hypothetical protein
VCYGGLAGSTSASATSLAQCMAQSIQQVTANHEQRAELGNVHHDEQLGYGDERHSTVVRPLSQSRATTPLSLSAANRALFARTGVNPNEWATSLAPSARSSAT